MERKPQQTASKRTVSFYSSITTHSHIFRYNGTDLTDEGILVFYQEGREKVEREEKTDRKAGRKQRLTILTAAGKPLVISLSIPQKLVSNCTKSALKDLGNLKD